MVEYHNNHHREIETTNYVDTVGTPLSKVHIGVTATKSEDELVVEPGRPRARKRG